MFPSLLQPESMSRDLISYLCFSPGDSAETTASSKTARMNMAKIYRPMLFWAAFLCLKRVKPRIIIIKAVIKRRLERVSGFQQDTRFKRNTDICKLCVTFIYCVSIKQPLVFQRQQQVTRHSSKDEQWPRFTDLRCSELHFFVWLTLKKVKPCVTVVVALYQVQYDMCIRLTYM